MSLTRRLKLFAPSFVVLSTLVAAPAIAQTRPLDWSDQDKAAIAFSQPVIAFDHVAVVDRTGAKPLADHRVPVRDGRIAAIAPAGTQAIPSGATLIDGRSKTLPPASSCCMNSCSSLRPKRRTRAQCLTVSQDSIWQVAPTLRTAGSAGPYADTNIARAVADAIWTGH